MSPQSPSLSPLQTQVDILFQITDLLSPKDSLSLSSTCRQLRWLLRPILFSTCPWKNDLPIHEPPESVWDTIRHLYVQIDDDDYDLYKYLTQHDLSNIESVHFRATFISTCISYIVNNTPRLHTLDLRYLCSTMYQRADPINFEELDAFPPLVTRPRVLHFCSQTEGAGSGFAPDECTSRMRGTRFPFATLLHQLDVGQIEHLEVGAEALSLPFAVTYTWSSLRELIITRIRMHNDPQTPLDDPRLRTPASAHEAVHLGTLVCAAPQLRVLRVRCHRSDLYPHVQWTVWPPDDPPLPSRSSMPAIEEFELYNPFAADGVYKYLPSTLRTLSLLNYPHVQCATLATEGWEIQPPPYPMDGVLRPAGLMHALSAVSVPELRTLRISFRDVDDTRLWSRIAELFPLLEVLELYDEIGPGSIWNASKLASCARALSSLSHLRSLRLSTFRRVLDAEDWKGYPGEREVYETPDQKARAGILMEDVKSALFGDDVGGQTTRRVATHICVSVSLPFPRSQTFPTLESVRCIQG